MYKLVILFILLANQINVHYNTLYNLFTRVNKNAKKGRGKGKGSIGLYLYAKK